MLCFDHAFPTFVQVFPFPVTALVLAEPTPGRSLWREDNRCLHDNLCGFECSICQLPGEDGGIDDCHPIHQWHFSFETCGIGGVARCAQKVGQTGACRWRVRSADTTLGFEAALRHAFHCALWCPTGRWCQVYSQENRFWKNVTCSQFQEAHWNPKVLFRIPRVLQRGIRGNKGMVHDHWFFLSFGSWGDGAMAAWCATRMPLTTTSSSKRVNWLWLGGRSMTTRSRSHCREI